MKKMKNHFRRMKSIGHSFDLRIAGLFLALFASAPQTVFAVTVLDRIKGIACNIANYVFTFAIIASTFMALIAAYKYMTAGGDSTKVSEAHRTILYAAIGVAVTLLAGGFPYLIAGIVGESISGKGCS